MNKYLIFALILLASCSNSQSQKNKTAIRNEYPENYGFDSEILSQLVKTIRDENLNVNSIYIQRNNVPVLDAHFYPQKAEYLHDVASITKSITSILVGIAIDKGFITSVEQTVADFFPNNPSLFDSEHKKEITIAHLLTMTSGICSNFSQGENMRDIIKSSDFPLKDIFASTLTNPPGEKFVYCSAGVQLLSMIIEETSGMTMEQLAKEYLFSPLEIENYKFGTDLSGFTNASGDIYLTAVDLAKIGQLVLNKGSYNGKQIVSAKWIEASITPKVALSNEESYGYLWWLREDLGGLIEAQGRGGQRLIILPEKQIVIVMYGTGFEPSQLGSYIVNALKSDAQITANEQGYQLLKEELARAKKPALEDDTVYISPLASELCARTYVFDNNNIGFSHFRLCAKDPDTAYVLLGLNITKSNEVGDRKVPIGLKGTYKISDATRFKTPMAAKAQWIDSNTIVIDYNEFSNAHKYQMTIRFDGDNATFEMIDEADYGNGIKLSASKK
ncbi:serine hydrolase [uncultured Roseivirga sp.]|uniref:serine hydrolase domain-containing protein n=1 Tax=uncultured Roseivirga sp. TaxID=543088 RepID=UPI00258CD06A|nr:serine hydrolase [uncultured Roseivirga sp.]|tara:strand:- start:1415 stop:2920 length:1506 start_codon:yes stop_codon:yes gene_type:complete